MPSRILRTALRHFRSLFSRSRHSQTRDFFSLEILETRLVPTLTTPPVSDPSILGSVRGRVVYDVDSSGLLDSTEPGISDVTVSLTSAGGDATFDTADDETCSLQTDFDGYFSFDSLDPASYLVTVNSIPFGLTTPTTDLDGIDTSMSAMVLLDAGVTREDVVFGVTGSALLGDRIWFDLDGNGLEDAGEPGVANVPLSLTWLGPDNLPGTDDQTFHTATDSTGIYAFFHLPSGDYLLSLDPAGLPPGTIVVSSPDGSGMPDAAVTLGPGDGKTDADYGLTGTASLEGKVVFDVAGQGTPGAGATGIPDAHLTLQIAGADQILDTADDLLLTTTSAFDGSYLFPHLPAGQARITAAMSVEFPGTSLTLTPGQAGVVTLMDAEALMGVDFGFTGTSSLNGVVAIDVNNDQVLQDADPGIAGVVMTLTGNDVLGPVEPRTTLTDELGQFRFEHLLPGSYTVTESQPSAYNDGPVLVGETGGSAGENSVSDIVIGPDADVGGLFFAEQGTTLAGRIFRDLNRNGFLDSEDPGLGGVLVALVDASGTPIATIGTLQEGNYLFDHLPAGQYQVVAVSPRTEGATTALHKTVDLPLSGVTGVNFGATGSTVRGRVVLDRDGNGTASSAEIGLVGRVVHIRGTALDGAPVVRATVTGSGGDFQFQELPAGTYTLTEDATQTIRTGVQILPGIDALGLDLVLPNPTGCWIEGKVFIDANGNGMADPGETGLGNVPIALRDASGNPLSSARTSPDGTYHFDGLPAGVYTLVRTLPTGYVTEDSAIRTFLLSEGSHRALDWSVQAGRLGGHVFHQGTTNRAVSGIVVHLTGTDALGRPMDRSATTGVDGSYHFLELPAGTYTIQVTLPTGLTATGATTFSEVMLAAGDRREDLDVLCSSPEGETFLTGTLRDSTSALVGSSVVLLRDGNGTSIASTMTDAQGHFFFANVVPGAYDVAPEVPPGYGPGTPAFVSVQVSESGLTGVELSVTLGSLQGQVYIDADGDGQRGATEIGLGGIRIVLEGTDSVGVAVHQTVLSAPDGSYVFNQLRAGTYTLTEISPTDRVDGIDQAGTLGGTVSPDRIHSIVVAAGQTGTGYDFGESPLLSATLSGTVSLDLSGDGVRQTNEPGIDGIPLTLRDAMGTVVAMTYSNLDGSYRFSGLAPGIYHLEAAQAHEYLDGTDIVGSAGGMVVNDGISEIPLTEGLTATGYDFTERVSAGTGSVRGKVFFDRDSSGVQDVDEPGLSGVVVVLADHEGTILEAVVTDSSGNYAFANLFSEFYTVSLASPLGYGHSTPINSEELEVLPGGSAGFDMGLTRSRLQGQVLLGGSGLGGVQVRLSGNDRSGLPVTAEVVSASDGSITFDDLLGGGYSLEYRVPDNVILGTFTVGNSGGTATTQGFAEIAVADGAIASGYLQTTQIPDTTIVVDVGLEQAFVPVPMASADGEVAEGEEISAFVERLYRDLLDREPEEEGRILWETRLREGASRTQVALAFWESEEHRERQVTAFYQTLLGRAPDPVGLAAFLEYFQTGASEADVTRVFVLSEEYQTLHVGNEALATALYMDLLGRTADDEGKAFLMTQLESGITAGDLARQILASDECLGRFVDRLYELYLRREADPSGRAYWIEELSSGRRTSAETAAGIVAQDEYLTR